MFNLYLLLGIILVSLLFYFFGVNKAKKLNLQNNKLLTYDMPEMITAMSLRSNGDMLIESHHGINNFNFKEISFNNQI